MATDVDPALIEMFDRQWVEFFLVARSKPWADIKIDDDVVWGTTGLPVAAFNGATAATFSDGDADERIEAILGYFRELRIDMTWWVGPTSTPADLADRLVAHGLTREEPAPGMACSLEAWSPPASGEGIQTELVTDDVSFHLAMEIMFAGFEMPDGLMPKFEERYRDFCIGARAIEQVFLARLDGVAVATSLGYIVDGVVGIYNVATLPGARRRGAGTAATTAAMADGKKRGAHAAILESSSIGRSLYERLGFSQVCEVTILAGQFGA